MAPATATWQLRGVDRGEARGVQLGMAAGGPCIPSLLSPPCLLTWFPRTSVSRTLRLAVPAPPMETAPAPINWLPRILLLMASSDTATVPCRQAARGRPREAHAGMHAALRRARAVLANDGPWGGPAGAWERAAHLRRQRPKQRKLVARNHAVLNLEREGRRAAGQLVSPRSRCAQPHARQVGVAAGVWEEAGRSRASGASVSSASPLHRGLRCCHRRTAHSPQHDGDGAPLGHIQRRIQDVVDVIVNQVPGAGDGAACRGGAGRQAGDALGTRICVSKLLCGQTDVKRTKASAQASKTRHPARGCRAAWLQRAEVEWAPHTCGGAGV